MISIATTQTQQTNWLSMTANTIKTTTRTTRTKTATPSISSTHTTNKIRNMVGKHAIQHSLNMRWHNNTHRTAHKKQPQNTRKITMIKHYLSWYIMCWTIILCLSPNIQTLIFQNYPTAKPPMMISRSIAFIFALFLNGKFVRRALFSPVVSNMGGLNNE